jgi:type I restriction enzyme S subunit
MELKPGYKQTEVGVIPEDWDVKPLSAFADVKTGPFGSSLHERDYVSDGTPIITVEHLSEQCVVHENIPLVSDIDRNRLSSYSLRAGDIVFSRVGSVDRNALIRDSENGWLFSGRLLRVRVLRSDVYPPYLSFHFHSEHFKQRVRTVAVGQTMASLNTQILKGVYAILPNENEQRVIATALNDVDALLRGLDQLIAKKRDLKQAAMQQLLTGRTRLPGFSGEWELTRLGDVLSICHGKSQRNVEVADGPYPILATGGKIGTSQRALYTKPSVLIGRKGTINQPQYMEKPFWTVDTLFYSAVKDNNSAKFLYYRFCLIDWMQFNEASGVPSLNARTIENIEIDCPQPIEQAAISSVLTDMDAELSALEKRRDKTRDLKQAMMHELLTGKIRLV